MKIRILGTGSTGNCLILDDTIALDFGVADLASAFVADLPILGRNQAKLKLKAIILSHSHIDHTKSVNAKTLQQFINLQAVYLPSAYLASDVNSLKLAENDKKVLTTLPADLINREIGAIEILARFDVKHDVPNDGYIFKYKDKLICFATDIGDVKTLILGYNYDAFKKTYRFYTAKELLSDANLKYENFDAYIIECNQDKNVLNVNTANAKTAAERRYFKRTQFVHMNTDDTAKILPLLRDKPVLLIHRSQINLPLTKQAYFFLNETNKNVAIALNPWEHYDAKLIQDLHLVKELEI